MLAPYIIQNIVRAVSRKYKVRVQEGDHWSANLTTNTITYAKDHAAHLSFDELVGYLLHEIGHLLETKTNVKTPETLDPHAFKSIVNAIEDIRITAALARRFPHGFRHLEAVDTNDYAVLKTQLEEVKGDTKRYGYTDIIMLALLDYRNEGVTKYPDKKKVKVAAKLANKLFDNPPERMKKVQEVADFVEKDLYPLVAKYIKKDPHPEKDISRRCTAHGEGDSVEKKAGAKEYLEVLKRMKKGASAGEAGRSIGIGGGIETTPTQRFIGYAEAVNENAGRVNTLSKRFATINLDNRITRYGGAHRSGKLNKKTLHRYATGDSKLFARKRERKDKALV